MYQGIWNKNKIYDKMDTLPAGLLPVHVIILDNIKDEGKYKGRIVLEFGWNWAYSLLGHMIVLLEDPIFLTIRIIFM